MRFSSHIILWILVFVLAGAVSCNKGGDAGDQATVGNTPAATSTTGGSGGIVAAERDDTNKVVQDAGDWPADVPKYPGSTVIRQDANTGGEAWAAVLSTTDGKGQVLGYYRDKLEAGGFTYRNTDEIEGATIDHYSNEDISVNIGFEENEHGRAISVFVMGLSMLDPDEDDGAADGEADDGDAPPADTGDSELTVSTGNCLTGYAAKVLKQYSGSEITQTIIEGEENAMMQIIQAEPEKIIAFYEKHWTSLGMKRTDNIDMGAMRMVAFEGPKGKASCNLFDAGEGHMATTVFTEEAGADEGGGQGGSSAADSVEALTMVSGKLPEGWPVKVLPQYPGSKIGNAAINGDEYTLLQTSADAENEVVKFYDKHFREAKWKKVTSMDVMGRYVGGWEKDGWSIDMTCSKEESGGSFVSLVYYK